MSGNAMSPLRLFITVLLLIFTVEFAVMLALPAIVPAGMDPRLQSVPDAGLLTLFCAPVLWWLMSDRRRAEAERSVRARQQAVAFEFSRRALACEEVPELLKEATVCLKQTLGAQLVGIWESSSDDAPMLLTTGLGWHPGVAGKSTWELSLQPSTDLRPFPCRAYTQGMLCGHCNCCPPALDDHGARTGICVVIQGDRRPFGVIGVYSTTNRSFCRDDIHFLQDIAIEITLAVQRSQVEQRRREREMLRAEQLALVAQIATGVAHEIRNPLTSVKMLIQANREEEGGQPLSQEDLQIIEAEIRRMERCLQTFLDYARPSKPERKPTDLSVLLKRTITLVQARAARQNVELRFQPPAEPFHVEVDPGQIQQIMLNLAINALDAMPQGGVVEIALRRQTEHVEITMLDSGPGITETMLAQLFQPFVTEKESGVGLGLVVSRRIAEDHGGSLLLQNHSRGGARAILRLPVAKTLI
jgi:signal transduction histidine kinase